MNSQCDGEVGRVGREGGRGIRVAWTEIHLALTSLCEDYGDVDEDDEDDDGDDEKDELVLMLMMYECLCNKVF